MSPKKFKELISRGMAWNDLQSALDKAGINVSASQLKNFTVAKLIRITAKAGITFSFNPKQIRSNHGPKRRHSKTS